MEVEAEMPLTPGIQPPDTSYHLQHTSHRRAAPSLVGQRPDYKTHGLRAQMGGEFRKNHVFPSPHACFDQAHQKHSLSKVSRR